MLARRIIPCLDVANGRVVKGVHFESLRDAGDPVEQGAFYDAEGADELVFLDIAASYEVRSTTLDMVSRVADRLFIPFTVGGGIRTVADAGHWLCEENPRALERELLAFFQPAGTQASTTP